MKEQLSRRKALLAIGSTGLYLSAPTLDNAANPLTISGVRVDMAVAALTDSILRITVFPALSPAALPGLNGDPVLHLLNGGRSLLKGQPPATAIAWGTRHVRVTAAPLTIDIQAEGGKPTVL